MPFVYLDQNVLSEMRERLLSESHDEKMRALKTIVTVKNHEVLYTSTHLREIRQIPREDYRQEHLDLLHALDASYLNPITNVLTKSHPHQVWQAFLENNSTNRDAGIDSVSEIQNLINRKLSGLPIDQTFCELNSMLQTKLESILIDALDNLDSSLPEDADEDQIESVKLQIESRLEQLKSMEWLKIPDNQELGPRPFRALDRIKEIQSLPPERIIPAIEEFFQNENPNFHWHNYFEDTYDNQIAVCYSLLNWAGFWADDFTSAKKGKDRFNASNNDLMHVQSGARCSFLVSNDVAFLKKSDAIYKHLSIGTLALKPEDALQYL